MTRELHSKTKVQRAEDVSSEPEDKRRRGYEDRDAPPRKVAWGIAGFLGIMMIGLAFSAGTIEALTPRYGLFAKAVEPPTFPHASLPPLLADPIAHRRAVEAEARAHLDPARIEAAMEQEETPKGGKQK